MTAIYDWFGYDLPIRERYRLIREAGFDGVMLWWSDGFGRDAQGRGDYRNGPGYARAAGLYVENIHAPVQGQNDLWRDDLAGEALLDCYLGCIDDCAEFAIPAMVVHLPDTDFPCNALGLRRIWEIAEKAERRGVHVALENVRNLANVEYVLSRVDSARIGFCYDACHHFNYCPDRELLPAYGGRLRAVHLHGDGGERAQHSLPFDGNIDWPAVMGKIAATGYAGAVAIEAMNWHYLGISAEAFLREAFAQARRLVTLSRTEPTEAGKESTI